MKFKFPGFLSLLTLLLIYLKATGYIDLSWWWVLLPLIVPMGIAIFLFAIIGILYVVSQK